MHVAPYGQCSHPIQIQIGDLAWSYGRHITYGLSLQWRHNERDSVSNHQPHDCLLNRLFRRRSKKTSKLRVTGLCAGNSPGTGEFPAQMASYAENVSIWWRHHGCDHKWNTVNFINMNVHRVCFGFVWFAPDLNNWINFTASFKK